MKDGRQVDWRGYKAEYSEAELKIIGKLFKHHREEAAVIHEAKARFRGRLRGV